MWLNGYLDRPPDQQILQVREGLRYLIYALGDKGAKVLAQRKGYGIQKIRWSQKNDQVQFPYIKHALFISQFFTCLTLALGNKVGVELADWRQGKEIEDRVKRPPYLSGREARAKKPLIRPDALFGIHYLATDEVKFFYLEADRGTVRERTMLARYKKYWAYWKQKRYVNQGIPAKSGFRVLTVCKNPTRAENLRELIKENNPWWGKTSMFWFTYKQWSIENPKPILGMSWRIPKDEKLHSLSG